MAEIITQSQSSVYDTAERQQGYLNALTPLLQGQKSERIIAVGRVIECCRYFKLRHINNPDAIAYSEYKLRAELGKNWRDWCGHIILTDGDYRFNAATNRTRQVTVSNDAADACKRQNQLARQRKVPAEPTENNMDPIRYNNAIKHGRKGVEERSNAKLPSLISVATENIDMLDTVYINWLENPNNPTLAPDVYRELFPYQADRKLETWQRDTEIMLQMIKDNGGLFPQEYEHRNGKPRYQGMGLSLQNCHKTLRYAALAGQHSYDINCCHHVIVQHFAALAGIKCPTIDGMVADKAGFRQALSTATGIPLADIKTALLMIVYGANFQWFEPYDDDSKVSLLQLLRQDGHDALQADPLFKQLQSELTRVFNFIVKHHKPTKGQTGYRNAMGQTLKTSDKPKKSQIVAFILQAIEARAAQAMIEQCETARVLIHDGIVTAEPEHVPTLEKSMLDATGILFTLDHELIVKPSFLP